MERHNNAHLVHFVIWGFCVLLWAPAVAHGATYYVRTDGNNANTGLTNTAGGAWRTMGWAADHVSAGDVLRVQAGTYPERVAPGLSGTSGSPITFVADGAVRLCGMNIAGRTYLRVIGFTMDSRTPGCAASNGVVILTGSNSHLEFWNNTFSNATYDGIRVSSISDSVNSSIVVGNTFHSFGIGNGSGTAARLRGDHNLIAYNEVYNSHPDAFYMYGSYNRWLNNYTHDLSEVSGGHSDVFQVGSNPLGWAFNVFEAHFQDGIGDAGDEHTAQISHTQAATCPSGCGTMTENVFRRNVWHNVSSYTVGVNQTDDGTVDHTRYYHNTTVGAQRNYPTARYGIAWYGNGTNGGYILNNIEYQSWGDGVTSGVLGYYVSGGLVADYNLAYAPGGTVSFVSPWTSQAHARSNVNPEFVDYSNDNFALGASSAARGSGGPLTTVRGSGSGTTFNVVQGGGGFFRGSDGGRLPQYGGNLAPGDVITVGTTTRSVERVAGDAISVTEPFTWTDGQAVYFGRSAAPDIGAYPYNAGGYNLTATYAETGGTVTVTPSDPSLVRFVVCYEDGIPAVVDNSSPFTCSVGDGALDVRVYPLYPSKRLFVPAASGESSNQAPAAPVNVTIK